MKRLQQEEAFKSPLNTATVRENSGVPGEEYNGLRNWRKRGATLGEWLSISIIAVLGECADLNKKGQKAPKDRCQAACSGVWSPSRLKSFYFYFYNLSCLNVLSMYS